jgi:glycosyltransferase involved in cell wall biosynthesis
VPSAEHADEWTAGARRPVELSIIVPTYNEEDSVRPLYDAVVAAVEPLGLPFELILVDDGSRDETFARAAALAAHDRRVRVIKFRRNYGQTAAMVAGIDHARGEILVTMDGDLQNDPADIPAFIDKIREGYDLVVGWRHKRQDKFWTRKVPSVIANWLIAKITGVPIKDNGCSLKAYRAELIKNIPLYSEMHRFIPAMTSIAGARIAQLRVRHHPRRFGTSKYGLSRVYKVFLDLLCIKTILLFTRRPLLWFAGAASLAGAFSLLFGFVAVLRALDPMAAPSVVYPGLAILCGALALFLVFLGVLGSLVYRTGAVRLEAFSALSARMLAATPKLVSEGTPR